MRKKGRRVSRGFTLIELLIAFAVFAVFSLVIYFLFQQTMVSFNSSNWKQDKASQSELFWQLLRKQLEEASNKNLIEESGTDLNVNVRQRPLRYRSLPPGTPAGDLSGTIMAWTRNRNNDAGLIEYQLFCRLSLADGVLTFEVEPVPGSPTPPTGEVMKKTVLSDVEFVTINCIPIQQTADAGEYLDPGSTVTDGASVVGTIAEISIVCTPPKHLRIPNVKVTQNNKFKIGVGSSQQPQGSPTFSYPFD
jgi:prepilin-type N-terminal cleavage/methylation domain-containing protein